MVKGKKNREKGKIKLSEYFKKLSKGDTVSLVVDKAMRAAFPKRIKGLTGEVVDFRGEYCLIKINDGNKPKTFIIHPVHLRKMQNDN